MNGYPFCLVQGVINKSWEKETMKTILKEHPLPENDQKKSRDIMISCMPHTFKVSQKTCKRSYADSILEWCTKKGTQ